MYKKLLSVITAAVTGLSAIGFGASFAVSAEKSDTKLIALTFDDGPNTTTTNDVLDLLEEYDAKASFFLIGDNINEESAVSVKRAYDMGMEIDNHSKTHSNMSKMSADELRAEIEYVDEKVKEITGEPTRFFRPPFIDVSQSMYEAIDQPFICGIDCQDYMDNVSPQERADYILNGAKDGVIVLLHDAAGNQKTVDALKIAMPVLREQGYEFVTLTELFRRQGETPKDNILYSNVAKYPCEDYKKVQDISSDATDRISLDPSLLSGSGYAIELEYNSPTGYPPVVALQRWSGTPAIWQTVQPFYFNGERAVFLAEDINSALEQLGVSMDELDGIGITAYTGEITLSNARILTAAGSEEDPDTPQTPEEPGTASGDVNSDGAFNVSDVILFHKWLTGINGAELSDLAAADLSGDDRLNVADLCIMKNMLIINL